MQKVILQGLRDSFKDKVEFHNGCIEQIEKQVKVLQGRIDAAYLDKLDKKIGEDFWRTQSKKWIEEKDRLTMKLLAHQKADANYLENASLVLELAQKAVILFKRRNSEQKRQLINLLVSNCSYSGKSIDVQLKSPFDQIMKAGKSGKWLPLDDMFRNHKLEFGISLSTIQTAYSIFRVQLAEVTPQVPLRC